MMGEVIDLKALDPTWFKYQVGDHVGRPDPDVSADFQSTREKAEWERPSVAIDPTDSRTRPDPALARR